MNSHNTNHKYHDNGIDNADFMDTKSLMTELFDLYKKNIISEKSFKYFSRILLTSYIENEFYEKYAHKLHEFDEKLTVSLLSMGKSYGGRESLEKS